MSSIGKPIIGFSLSSRYLGVAVVANGRSVLLRTLRLQKDGNNDFEKKRIGDAITALLKKNQPSFMVAVGRLDDENMKTMHEAISDLVRASELALVNMTREQIAESFGLTEATNAAIRRHLSANDDVVAAHLVERPGLQRSELDRYWENAIVAAAAALAASRQLR